MRSVAAERLLKVRLRLVRVCRRCRRRRRRRQHRPSTGGSECLLVFAYYNSCENITNARAWIMPATPLGGN